MNKKPYISPSVSVITIESGNILQASGQRSLNVSNETVTEGFADARESFGFEEISEEE